MQNKRVFVLGASNVDIVGFPKEKLVIKDANIGKMEVSAGGVGRNIAHNLKLLGFDVQLASIFGDDSLSQFLINNCNKNKLDISNSLIVRNSTASSFIAIMDKNNDLSVGISAMDIYNDKNGTKLIDKLPDKINTDYIVLETNFVEQTLKQIVLKYSKKKFVVDTVSGIKSLRIIPVLSKIHILKTNLLEAKRLSNMQINDDKDLYKLVKFFIDKGVNKVFITLGENGVVYGDRFNISYQKAIKSNIVNTIGAGDSFVAGLVLADYNKVSIDLMAKYGMAAAGITVQSKEAVNLKLSEDKIMNIINYNK